LGRSRPWDGAGSTRKRITAMSTRFLTRLLAVERTLHHREQQDKMAREREEWQDALQSVRARLDAVLRGEPMPESDTAEAGEGFTGSEWSDVQERLRLKLEQTRARLKRAMGVNDGEHKNSFD
jgi:hypothetical protein